MALKHQTCILAAVLLCAAPVLADGGDTCAEATVIPSLPFSDTGTTNSFADDYEEVCPYNAPGSEDVVYSYTPTMDVCVDISLCDGSAYDTKLYVYENECQVPDDGQEPFACNDDACTSPFFPDPYVSRLATLQLFAGNTYYIVVDGYGGESGNYVLDVTECPTGACCVGQTCAATNNELECTALGGTWFEGESCPGFTCPDPCPEDTLRILIRTDNWAEETSWDLYEQGGGLVASGGPLEYGSTLHEWTVCLESAKCYDFTIYDTYGDGICCMYGEGWYELVLNGAVVGYGGEFGDSETVQVGSSCPDPCPDETVEIVIFTDDYPEETTWELFEVAGIPITGGPLHQAGTLYTRTLCVDSTKCFDFTIFDSAGDGICCDYGSGWYEVYYGGELMCSGGEFGSSEACTAIGNCGDGRVFIEILTDEFGGETTWEFVDRNSGTLVGSGGPLDDDTLYQIEVPVFSAGCYDFTIYDDYGDGICCDGYYNVFYQDELVCAGGGTGDPFSERTCENVTGGCGDATLLIEVFTDRDSFETTWRVVDRETGSLASWGGPYDDPNSFYSAELSVHSIRCYDFTIYDSYGDGICCENGPGYWNVLYNGALVCTGGDFEFSESCLGLGDGCGCPNPGNSGNYCTADITNLDCIVDLSDLAQLLGNYGATSGAEHDDGDLDGDGDVDLSDLAELLGQYGDDCN
ncbi:MAG: hypothetical protein KKI02_04880 [Planctomycetes bacterium]|nr:hypothetical protein [Planctomycetota bacterium]